MLDIRKNIIKAINQTRRAYLFICKAVERVGMTFLTGVRFDLIYCLQGY